MRLSVLAVALFVLLSINRSFGGEAQTTATLDGRQHGVPVEVTTQPGAENLTSVTAGIPVYGEDVVHYRAKTGESYQIQFGEPRVVSVASKPEKWGYHQFPSIGRNDHREIWVKWNLSADSIKAYGKGAHAEAVSRDRGRTWSAADDDFTSDGGTLMPNGDRINVTTPVAVPEDELDLPEPVGKAHDNYAKKAMTLYRHSELPESRQGVYLDRLASGTTEWKAERAKLDDPAALRYSFQGLVPVVWWGDMHALADGSVVTGIYPGFWQTADGSYTKQYGVIFYRSTDNGHSWKVQGRIPYEPDALVDAKAEDRMGFSEPGFEVLTDGTFLCVMRTTDGSGPGPMYASTSKDQGKTWTAPAAITANGVLPRLLQLKNGVTVLSAGRPGVQLRFGADSSGEKWTEPFEMLPWKNEKDDVSCAYTGLLATGPERFLMVYSDFKHENEQGELRKAIKVREIVVKRIEVEEMARESETAE